MAWDKTKPIGTTKVKDSPTIFTGNWAALEETIGKEHYDTSDSMSGMHKPGYAGVVYYGPLSALSALYANPPCGSFAIVMESTSGALALAMNVSSAGSGTWNNVTPSHLMLADLTCGDPHPQYLNKGGGSGSTISGDLIFSDDIIIAGTLGVSGLLSSNSVSATFVCDMPGVLSASTAVAAATSLILPFACTIRKVIGFIAVAPSGQSVIFDIHYSSTMSGAATTIWTSQVNRPQIPVGEMVSINTDMNVTSLSEGGRLTFYTDQVGTPASGAGTNATIHVLVGVP